MSAAIIPVSLMAHVAIDGLPISSTDVGGNPVWTYEPAQNWVRFELMAAPPVGANIDIGYQLLCQ